MEPDSISFPVAPDLESTRVVEMMHHSLRYFVSFGDPVIEGQFHGL